MKAQIEIEKKLKETEELIDIAANAHERYLAAATVVALRWVLEKPIAPVSALAVMEVALTRKASDYQKK